MLLQANDFWNNGDCSKWLMNASPHIKALSATVNGPMLELLAGLMGAEYVECVDYFRTGFHFFHCVICHNWLAVLCAGAALLNDHGTDALGNCLESNKELLKGLRCDANEKDLHDLTMRDWKLGRMSKCA